MPTAAHAYAPLHLLPAARGNAAIPNTEVKLMYTDNTWRAPVAVPDKIFGLTPILDFIDRCHSLASLPLPLAAVGSLPWEDK